MQNEPDLIGGRRAAVSSTLRAKGFEPASPKT
jgi:hypothetical protein